jgi:thioredoxin reductase (NADPH)
MPSTETTDVAVVGAGPIGIELAVALKRAGFDYLHFDARQIGYTISWFAPQTRFFSSNERISIAGVPLQTPDGLKCTREQYLTYLRTVVEQFDLKIRTYEPVTGIERVPGDRGFVLTTRPAGGEKRVRCQRLVLVTGGTDRPRKLGIPGEDAGHVSHYFDDPHKYVRKRVLVVGGKNSAVEAALRCHSAGAYVSLSYRREKLPHKSIKYWLLPEINGLMDSGRITAYFNTVPTEITPTRVKLERWTDPASRAAQHPGFDFLKPEPRTLTPLFDFVLLLIGYEADMSLAHMAGIELAGECQRPTFDERTMETNVPNLYVAGTAVAGTQDKYRVFIENCHVHVDRILAALTGAPAPAAPQPLAAPET